MARAAFQLGQEAATPVGFEAATRAQAAWAELAFQDGDEREYFDRTRATISLAYESGRPGALEVATKALWDFFLDVDEKARWEDAHETLEMVVELGR